MIYVHVPVLLETMLHFNMPLKKLWFTNDKLFTSPIFNFKNLKTFTRIIVCFNINLP